MAGYVPNPGFEATLSASAFMQGEMVKRAAMVGEVARGLAEEVSDRGYYRSQIAPTFGRPARIGLEGGMATAYVDAFDFKSHWVEWGSTNNPAHHIIQRAVEIALHLPLRGD